jgi:4-hydroxybenzoate polyprenyltransferase
MPLVTIVTGLLLAALGVSAYLSSGTSSLHPLGPAFLGLLLVGFGIAARSPGMKKHAMHGAAVVGLLGALGTLGGAFAMSRRGVPLSSGPGMAVVASVVIFVAFEVLCVLSFIAARKARQSNASA